MNRHHVRAVICVTCDKEQPPSAECIYCATVFGAYFCGVCNLFDDDVGKEQFHCEKCGICRVGGRENFFHCDTCGACYSTELQGNHICVPNSMQRDCPICYEFLFDSLEAPQVLRCGHTIHRKCLESYSAHGGYTCPLCNASVCDMRAAWGVLDEEIQHTPMPAELICQVAVLCNDCHKISKAAYHALGLKCSALRLIQHAARLTEYIAAAEGEAAAVAAAGGEAATVAAAEGEAAAVAVARGEAAPSLT
eukprot:CAMPEP_0181206922 /NCGR_PEP_ID=MMETSP1096-20121128/21295_1 /TAXON_ID=156174 ORGANISM="Chrysochromulina ericina, Strain CCMP281" /NCGR_SAMPLE_ID=MMETSP1096 /ASSEMBLY_ACC=CAM_ASM_000453 /LENGTH=249 /DNA_ID=CAMNT_0023297857 /DNA_START=82 /DNA_END=830 /DNA_ORIENTATION=+